MHQENPLDAGGRPLLLLLLLPHLGCRLLCLYAQPLLAMLLPQPLLQGGMGDGGPLLCLLQGLPCRSCAFCG